MAFLLRSRPPLVYFVLLVQNLLKELQGLSLQVLTLAARRLYNLEVLHGLFFCQVQTPAIL